MEAVESTAFARLFAPSHHRDAGRLPVTTRRFPLPVYPAQTMRFVVPDIYGRPRDRDPGDVHHEQGMSRPFEANIFDFRLRRGLTVHSETSEVPGMEFTLESLRKAAHIVHGHVPPTPQYAWPLLARHAGLTVWVKHENHTSIGAFKIRGGALYMHRLTQREPDCRGVIAATRGNHGQSVAVAAARHGLRATIVVPHGNNPEKNAAMIGQGAELVEHGNDFQEALELARERAESHGLHLVASFDPALVQGVASYALELFAGAEPLDAVYVPIGLGSGICGVIAARNALGFSTEIVGVQAEAAPCYALSFEAGRPMTTGSADTIADGVATRVPVDAAVATINRHAARVVTVSDEAILEAQRLLLRLTHNLAEPAGACALAALLKERRRMTGKTAAVILSGGNADAANLRRVIGGM